MKIILLTLALLLAKVTLVNAQSPFDPADPDVVFTSSNRPPVPAYGPVVKWGHSQNLNWGGTGSTSFKSYYYKEWPSGLNSPKRISTMLQTGRNTRFLFSSMVWEIKETFMIMNGSLLPVARSSATG